MNPTPLLLLAFKELNDSMKGSLDGTKIESIKETINNYALASAVAGLAAAVVPGVASVVAMLTQTGFVWATYVQINKTLGISMSEHTVKFLGTAIITNLATNAGTTLASYAAAAVISFIPLFGQALSAATIAALGYMMVYTAAVIYLKLISRLMLPNGTLNVKEDDDTKHIIEDIIKKNNIKDIIKEGRNSYKQAKADGSLDQAKKHPRCPGCGAEVKPGQKFCSDCGTALM
ncbi:zinc-ribbon domain-containing protein [Prevotella sp. E13-27]|uniref:zinc-ribbon domain-containing protein n=1 Tax=Prevotella sp. E13-27 TaxID=2938122 RepID=UPI00200AC8D9|nr:zinc-ribbon domain-containing protein [Prevotella sp. E13-27]MCK8621054.1 zinc ribbon domain-containing protein [Prevotella sp. E13-27]